MKEPVKNEGSFFTGSIGNRGRGGGEGWWPLREWSGRFHWNFALIFVVELGLRSAMALMANKPGRIYVIVSRIRLVMILKLELKLTNVVEIRGLLVR